MTAEFLHAVFEDFSSELACATRHGEETFEQLIVHWSEWRDRLVLAGVAPGDVVSLEADFGGPAIGALLALIENQNIVVPLADDSQSQREKFLNVAQVQWRTVIGEDSFQISPARDAASHPLYDRLRATRHPGLVLFSSGSTGESKGAVHDFSALLEKFHLPRHRWRTIAFLQLDHIGGINTLLYTLSNGGTVVVPSDRSPDTVCRAIEAYSVELLPTSPTFLNLLLLSDVQQRYDLSTLKRITYGTEPMPESTLRRIQAAFPEVTFQQTYGMTEFGILRSKSRPDGSLWMKVGGEGFDVKVVDGRLWVRAESKMLGYLNAPCPYDEDGYLDTGDQVAVDGEWIRVLGRCSEIINVGGNKVYPAEVENVLLEMDVVRDVVVAGERNSITGQTVAATANVTQAISPMELKTQVRRYCRGRLPAYAVPSRIQITDQPLYSQRFKRTRA